MSRFVIGLLGLALVGSAAMTVDAIYKSSMDKALKMALPKFGYPVEVEFSPDNFITKNGYEGRFEHTPLFGPCRIVLSSPNGEKVALSYNNIPNSTQ